MSRVLRHSNWDALLVALSFAHPAVLYLAPSIPVIALGVWWNSNTISHNFVHLPFFRWSAANRLYAIYLSVLLGIPQALWRERHLAHHRGHSLHFRWTPVMLLESSMILGVWLLMHFLAPSFLWAVYLPGYALGLVLCYLHGYFEHAGGTTSHYGWAYNLSFFNDGYHVEHHAQPGEHWTRLRRVTIAARSSRWPAILRWLESINLERLESIALRSRILQFVLLKTHERALRKLSTKFPAVRSVTIVGGGMYPRTAILLRRLLPDAYIRIVDASEEHLEAAKPFLDASIELSHERYIAGQPVESDLLVIPLSFSGKRDEVYRSDSPAAILVHDWIWARRGHSAVVSLLLLKRLNLITK
jgi:hypothetical protein